MAGARITSACRLHWCYRDCDRDLMMGPDFTYYARLTCRLVVCALAVICAPHASSEESSGSSPIAVVVHKDTQVDDLSFADLRSVFFADRQFWPDRTRITLLLRAPQSDERDFVLNRIYEMSEEQYQKYWIAKMFRAEVARGPQNVFSTDAALDLVVAIPGSISVVRADQVTDAVKVVRIDGALPNDAAYPLR